MSGDRARFVSGPIPRHIRETTLAAAIGLSAMFAVDLADMWFLSLLGETALAAAVGYAGAILFATTAIGIGLMIAASARASRAFGAGEDEQGRRAITHIAVFAVLLSLPIGVLATIFTPDMLALIGAEGEALHLATAYLTIILPSMPILALGMVLGGALRAAGAPRAAMGSTLVAGGINLVFDPILIFGLGWGIEGAAVASVLARCAALAWAAWAALMLRDLAARSNAAQFRAELRPIIGIAGPAMLTNLATPAAMAYVTAAIAAYGDGAVAGWSVIGRLQPVAFALVFALSGAIGPIIGQNAGAGRPDRVRQTLRDALIFVALCVTGVWLLLALAHPAIAAAFQASPDAAALIAFYCVWIAPAFLFHGALFAANAAFNNLGKPHWSTAANWGKATLGTIPFVMAGGALAGAPGALAGQAAGAVLFGVIGVVCAFRLIDRGAPPDDRPAGLRAPLSAFTSLRGWYGTGLKA